MARRDGTGPLGMGPMTGRGLGPCGAGYFPNRPRLGLRYGSGRGFRCYGYYDPYIYEPYPMDESTRRVIIEREKTILEARLKELNEMLK